jgi:peptide/nickel transport system substrate-binding protein
VAETTLRYAVDQIETSPLIDPHFEPAGNRRYYEVYEGLTALGPDGTPGPALARSWERVEPARVRFKLRSGAHFHDGERVTSADVVFSYQRARVPRKSFTVAGRLGSISSVEAVDELTVDIVTERPDPLLPTRLAELMILSRRQLESAADDVTPTGSGPYRIVEYDPARVIRLERWDEHDSRRPPFQFVEAHTMDATEREPRLRAGDIDLAMIRAEQRSGLELAGFRMQPGPVTVSMGYFLDTVNPDWPTADKRVRQALNYAVDKERILREVFGGLGTVTPGQFAPAGCFGNNPNIQAYTHDPAKAKALLSEAGYPNGFDVILDAVGYSWYDLPKAERIKADLAEIGVNATISLIPDLETALQRWYGRIPRGQLSPTSLSIAPAMDVEYALLWFDSDNAAKHHASAAFDEIHRPSQIELDPAARLRQLQRCAEILHEDPPFLWSVGPSNLYAFRAGLSGFRPRSDLSIVPDGLML